MYNNIIKNLLTSYFKKEKIIPSYGGGFDRVVDFNWNGGDWYVVVQAIKIDGSIDNNYPYNRKHATLPKEIENTLYKVEQFFNILTII